VTQLLTFLDFNDSGCTTSDVVCDFKASVADHHFSVSVYMLIITKLSVVCVCTSATTVSKGTPNFIHAFVVSVKG
jgi:hypothetical protein